MKIKLTNYPYQDQNVGDVCDFGEDKNKSLVALQRAVWYKETPFSLFKQPVIKPEEEEPVQVQAAPSAPKSGHKKLIKNELKDKIQHQKTQTTNIDKEKTSFWDRLK